MKKKVLIYKQIKSFGDVWTLSKNGKYYFKILHMPRGFRLLETGEWKNNLFVRIEQKNKKIKE